ncbi:MAG: CBS domain-containing protein [bacterium]
MPKLKVRDLMTEKVYSIRPDEDLARLNDLMSDLRVRHVPVVDEEGNLQGIVSHRDLLRSALDTEGALPLSEQRDLLRNTAVREIMVVEPETAEADQEIQQAGRVMLENKLGCLPVVEGERVVGILTEADFVKYVVELES